MSNENKNESEQLFKEDTLFLERIKKVKSKKEIDSFELLIEYNMLAERYSKLLKNAVRISRMSDKSQIKLLKYKEMIDMMRNL